MKGNNQISKYISLLKDQRSNKLVVVSEMLSNLSYDELIEANRRTPKIFASLISLKYLRRSSFGKIASSGYYFEKGENICEYIGVLAYIFEQHKECLNLFVDLFYEFEKSLLLGDYEKCATILNEINTKVSYSFWKARALESS